MEFQQKTQMSYQEKIKWVFQGSWFKALKFPSGVRQSWEVSKGKALFCLQFPGVK